MDLGGHGICRLAWCRGKRGLPRRCAWLRVMVPRLAAVVLNLMVYP